MLTPLKKVCQQLGTAEEMPTPLRKVCQQLGTAEEVTVTFDDLAGCDSVLLV